MRVSAVPARARTDSPIAKFSRHEPLVRGLTRTPASLRYGAPISAIDGSPLRSTNRMCDRSGLNEAWGVGRASSICAIWAGGCL